MYEPISGWVETPTWTRASYVCDRVGCSLDYFERPWRLWPVEPPRSQLALLPHPPPEVTMRDCEDDEAPRNAVALGRAASAAGIASRVTYSRGTSSDGRGNPTRVVDNVTVRVGSTTAGAAGVWLDRKFECGWAWSPATDLHRVGARELSAWVKAGCRP